jgi:hypothetical protein
MMQKILFFSTEPKKSANARARIVLFLFCISFFIFFSLGSLFARGALGTSARFRGSRRR